MMEAADYAARARVAQQALAFLAKKASAAEIATLAGIPVRTVYRWQARTTAPHGALLDKLLTAARARGFKE